MAWAMTAVLERALPIKIASKTSSSDIPLRSATRRCMFRQLVALQRGGDAYSDKLDGLLVQVVRVTEHGVVVYDLWQQDVRLVAHGLEDERHLAIIFLDVFSGAL